MKYIKMFSAKMFTESEQESLDKLIESLPVGSELEEFLLETQKMIRDGTDFVLYSLEGEG